MLDTLSEADCPVSSLDPFKECTYLFLHGDRNVAYRYDLVPEKRFNWYNSEQQAKIIEEYVGLKVYEELLRACDNCDSMTRSEYFSFVEALIRRDVNPGFQGLDGDLVRTTLEGP